jgi:prepilin-type N-terminal cleavage/methylation domain-containing protein
MKGAAIQIHGKRRKAGFTLLEMSTAMSLMVVLGVALVTLVSQHTQFLKLFRQQAFLATEAPQIGNLLGRILNEADHYFVYATKDDALSGGMPILTSGHALRLFFKTPTQETEERLIVVESTGSGAALKFYGWLADGTATSWTITSKIHDAEFLSTEGILNMTLEGPNGEEVTYGGGAR